MMNEEQQEEAQLRIKLANLNRELANLNRELANRNREIANRDRELAKRDRELAKRSLSGLKSRPISFVDRTNSDPHIYRGTHAPAKTTTRNIELSSVELPDSIWQAPYTRSHENEVSIDSEAIVISQITSILGAVLDGMGIRDLVSIATHRTVAGIECDIVLLYGSQRIPFSVIEVKKPGTQQFEKIIFSSSSDDAVIDAGIVAGQHFDQLCALECMGYTSLFGMITNGNKWMVCTTGDSTPFSKVQKDWGTYKR
jgi:hypothetical protein